MPALKLNTLFFFICTFFSVTLTCSYAAHIQRRKWESYLLLYARQWWHACIRALNFVLCFLVWAACVIGYRYRVVDKLTTN